MSDRGILTFRGLLICAITMLVGGRSLDAREWRHFKPSLRSQVQVLSQSSAQELLTELCTSEVRQVAKIGLECPVRPLGRAFTDMGDHFHPEGVIFGHFLGAASEDAVVSGWGLESHPDRWGGTLLLSRRDGKWKPQWYKSALITNACEKVGLPDERELLVCEDEDGGMGHTFHDLSVVDLRAPQDFQHNPPIAQAHAFDDSCTAQRQSMDPVVWSADRRSFSVVIRTPHWDKYNLDFCRDSTTEVRRPPVIRRLRFVVTPEGLKPAAR